MKLNLSDKIGYTIKTKDKKIGTIKDFLFDEDEWKIRYLEVEMAGLFNENIILVPIERIIKKNWIDEEFKIDLKEKSLRSMPSITDKKTVSREIEAQIAKHYKTEEYWGRRFIPSMAPQSTLGTPAQVFNPRQTSRVPDRIIREDDIQTSLRSFNELQGYTVYTNTGKVGHVEDILIESKTMEIISVVIDAEYGLGYSKNVILASNWIEEISYVEKGISLSLKRSEVFSSPKFSESAAINQKEIIKKFDYTGKPIH